MGKCICFGNIENTIFGVDSPISDGISKLEKKKKELCLWQMFSGIFHYFTWKPLFLEKYGMDH